MQDLNIPQQFLLGPMAMFWYVYGQDIIKHLWMLYAGVFIGILISVVLGLLFYDTASGR